MNQVDLIKEILKLSEELKENDGITSVMIIDDMVRIVDKYTKSQYRELLLAFTKDMTERTDMWRIPIEDFEVDRFLDKNITDKN